MYFSIFCKCLMSIGHSNYIYFEMWLLFHSLLIVCIFASQVKSSLTWPTVRVEYGEAAGTWHTLPNGRKVNVFYGLPYAAPPTGERRFEEPHNVERWIGVWNATTRPSSCLQYSHSTYTVLGEEDCLYLNVFTPKLPQNDVNPLFNVMVHLHGGAFMFGTGTDIDPNYIMQYSDMVYVTINYRLGPLGFFSTADDVVPGNNGLKDQVAALKWVQRNIIQFGGNPNSVTIFGDSAGGASVHYHFLSPLSEGLFHKGISLSGAVLPPWTLPRNNTQKSKHVAALTGCPTVNSRDMIECVRSRPGRSIVEISKVFSVWRYCPFTTFGPTVEPVIPKAFLTQEPVQMLKKGAVKNLPWLMGLTTSEGLYPAAEFLAKEYLLKELDLGWMEIAPHLFMYNYSVSCENERNNVSAEIKKFYFGNRPVSAETGKKLVKALGDRLYYNDISHAVKLHSSSSNQSIYCYLFDYRGKHSFSEAFSGSSVNYGVSHGDDLAYILDYLPLNSQETESDSQMVKFMAFVIDSFMKTGRPVANDTAWEALSKNKNDGLRCLRIYSSYEQKMDEILDSGGSTFWRKMLPLEYATDTR